MEPAELVDALAAHGTSAAAEADCGLPRIAGMAFAASQEQ